MTRVWCSLGGAAVAFRFQCVGVAALPPASFRLPFGSRLVAEEAHRALLQLEDSRAEAREQRMLGNFEAADQRAAEYEAQQRAARGPWIVEVDDEPNESLWTPEEFAEMQAATRAESERKRQAAWNLLNPTKRSRNS